MSEHQEHWFDRLSARHTRRGAIKAALAGGAALTLPLTRAAPALASDPHACQKGCRWTANRKYDTAFNACAGVAGATTALNLYGFGLGGAIFVIYAPGAGLSLLNGFSAANRCSDNAFMQLKAAYYDCTKDGCPGFDPTASGGPCDACAGANGICCPDQNSQTGYNCCSNPGGCCKADGCHSGVTDCGGM